MMLYENKVFTKWKIKEKRKQKRGEAKIKRFMAVMSTFATAIVIIFLLSWMVIPQITLSIGQLTSNFMELFTPSEEFIVDGEYIPSVRTDLGENDEGLSGYIILMDTRIGVRISEASATAQRFVSRFGINMDIENSMRELALSAATGAIALISEYFDVIINATAIFIFSTARQIFNILLGIVAAFYILLDKEKMVRQLKKLMIAVFPINFVQWLADLVKKTHGIFGGFIWAKVLESIIVGIICFIFLTIMRIEYPMLISAIIGITNIIPFFGPFIGAIPSIFILLTYDPTQALWFAIFILVLQQIDGNFIGPKIIGSRIGLTPFWVIFAIMVMTGLMGPLGMFIGVPTFSVIYTLIKDFVTARLNKKGIEISPGGEETIAEIAVEMQEKSSATINERLNGLVDKLKNNVHEQMERMRGTDDEK
jgi:predicted PurR-regulated permease PerM